MQTEILKVTGMTCDGCINKVTHALKAISGVNDVKVSLSAGNATVQFDEQRVSTQQLEAALKSAGYNMETSGTAQASQGKGCCG